LSIKPLSHQVGILMLGRVFAFAVMFFVPVVNVRALSVEAYGYYKQFWLLFETVTPILMLGFPRSLLYYIPRSESDLEKSVYVVQTVVFLFAMAMIAVIFYTVLGQVLGAGLGAMVRAFFWRLSFFTVCMMVARYMDELFVAEKKIERQAVYHVATTATQAIVVMAVSWYTRDVSAIIWALAIVATVKLLFALVYTWVVYRPSFRTVSFSTLREQLSFALPLGMMAIALLLLTQTDKFIINRYMGRVAFAIYSVGAFQLPIVHIVASSVASVAFPLMAQYQKEERYDAFVELWRRSWLKTSVLFFPIFVFFMVTAEQFIIIMFTESYAGAIPIFRIYLILFLKATTDYAGVLTAFKKQDYLFKILAAAVVANLVLSLVLFRVWGRLGVPVATVVSFFTVGVLAVRRGGQLLGHSFWQTVPWRGLTARMAAAAAPGAILFVVYARGGNYSIWRYAVAAASYFSVYFVVCWVTRLLTLDDIKSLLGRRPSPNQAR
jgi:O-antigen/teichoic acid export membrane protein